MARTHRPACLGPARRDRQRVPGEKDVGRPRPHRGGVARRPLLGDGGPRRARARRRRRRRSRHVRAPARMESRIAVERRPCLWRGIVKVNRLEPGRTASSPLVMHHPCRYFTSSPEVIRLAVMMSVRDPFSLRQGEDRLCERGIDICHETVRDWWNRVGPVFAAEIRKRRVHHRS